MKTVRITTVACAAALIIALFVIAIAGLVSIYSGPVKRDVGISSPIITATPTVKQEDDPTWDCFEDGNRICGDPEKEYALDGWAQWDIQNGGKYLRVDPSREYRVDYIGIAKLTPKLACNEIALPSLSYWYVFRATYLDGVAACE